MRGDGKLAKADAGKTNPDPANPNPAPTQVEDPTISTAKQSFDNKAQHFNKVLLLLQGEVLFKPNEPELTATELKDHLQALVAANQNADNSYTNLKAARISRKPSFMQKTQVCLTSSAKPNLTSKVFMVQKANNTKQQLQLSFFG